MPDPLVRTIDGSDSARLVRFHQQLSPETIRLRYHAPHALLTDAEVAYFVGADGEDHLACVACDEAGELLGVCRAIRPAHDAEDAELAMVVADRAQGHGVGTVLLEHVVDAARAHGVRRLDALILGSNRHALEFFERGADRLGLPHERHYDCGVVELRIGLEPPPHP